MFALQPWPEQLSEHGVAGIAETGPGNKFVRFVYIKAHSDARRAVRPCIEQIACKGWGGVDSIKELTKAQVAYTLSVVRFRC